MRNRIIIVVLGLSLGLGARFAADLYQQSKDPAQTEPATSKVKTPDPAPEPKDK